MGGRVRNVMAELHGEKIDIVDWSDDPAEFVAQRAVAGPGDAGRGRRPGGPVRPGDRARLPALAGDRQGRPERPPRRPAHRLADRHPAGHGARSTAQAPGPEAESARPAGGIRHGVTPTQVDFSGLAGVARLPGAHLCGMPGASGQDRAAARSWWSRTSVVPDPAVRCPAGVRTCTPPRLSRPGRAPPGVPAGLPRPGTARHRTRCAAYRRAGSVHARQHRQMQKSRKPARHDRPSRKQVEIAMSTR